MNAELPIPDAEVYEGFPQLENGVGSVSYTHLQREENYDVLVERMKELGLKEEDYNFYLDLRRYGTNKHAGFGLGFERAVMYITGVSNIRDVLPFPRTVGTAEY